MANNLRIRTAQQIRIPIKIRMGTPERPQISNHVIMTLLNRSIATIVVNQVIWQASARTVLIDRLRLT
jgi:hypothetical protein